MGNRYIHHTSAREEAFEWYLGSPPSPDEAREHFALKAKRDPEHSARYTEALEIFLATCWSIPTPTYAQESKDRHI